MPVTLDASDRACNKQGVTHSNTQTHPHTLSPVLSGHKMVETYNLSHRDSGDAAGGDERRGCKGGAGIGGDNEPGDTGGRRAAGDDGASSGEVEI